MTATPALEDIRRDLRLLDPPDEPVYGKLEYGGVDLSAWLVENTTATVEQWTASGRISVAKPGYGLACAGILTDEEFRGLNWDDPRALLRFGVATGGVPTTFVYNALRKLRAVVRVAQADYPFTSTQEIEDEASRLFRDVVANQEPDGTVRWGDFGYAGGLLVWRHDPVRQQNLVVPLAISVFKKGEDHDLAGEVGNNLLDRALAA
jgi:hypothetical protein